MTVSDEQRAQDTGPPASLSSWLRSLRDRIPKWAMVGVFIYATIFTLTYAQTLIVPILLGLLLSLIFTPIRRVFDRRGIPPWATALFIMIVLFTGLFLLAGALALPVTAWVEDAPQIMSQIRTKLAEVSRPLESVFAAFDRVQGLIGSDDPDVQRVKLEGGSPALDMMLLVPGALAQVVFTIVLLFFLLATGDMFYQKIVHVLPTFGDKRRAMELVRELEAKLSRYLLTITLINAGLGCVIGLAMWLYGMPMPWVFGLVAFIFNFVPYAGALVGVVISAGVALVTFDWIWWSVIVGGTYFMATFVEGQFVTPTFVGRSLRLNTVVVFLSVSFFAWTWSVVGMVVAIPVLIAMRTICRHVDSLQNLGEFLSDRTDYRPGHEEAEEA